MEDIKYWLWLSRIQGLDSIKIGNLLSVYKTPENIWNLNKSQLLKVDRINTEIANDILNINYKKDLNKYIEYMYKNNIQLININSNEYPNKLRDIFSPPQIIFIKGNKKLLNNFSIAIIGCRNHSDYGRRIAQKFAFELSQKDICIISGLARGIDSYSHIGCLEGCGKTIAVIGSGLDNIYPYENTTLAQKIVENDGAVISEYIIGTKPNKMNFPARNRIISGLSDGVLVIEARKRSGTLITVEFALEQGKNVFVTPGNIDNINSVGTNTLLKEGSKLTTCIEDILEEYYNKY